MRHYWGFSNTSHWEKGKILKQRWEFRNSKQKFQDAIMELNYTYLLLSGQRIVDFRQNTSSEYLWTHGVFSSTPRQHGTPFQSAKAMHEPLKMYGYQLYTVAWSMGLQTAAHGTDSARPGVWNGPQRNRNTINNVFEHLQSLAPMSWLLIFYCCSLQVILFIYWPSMQYLLFNRFNQKYLCLC